MKPIRICLAAVAILSLSACSKPAADAGDASSESAAPGDIPDGGDATASADAAAAVAAAMAASPTATDMPSGSASSQAASQSGSASVPPPVTSH
ncbi:hypothetical protein [Asticcacaulis solisilvae]|uniref:hypothetical protein n=1 Tax=Asticcacaulis solisilvae TaxID=1217274 RepID=UPI003FD8F118